VPEGDVGLAFFPAEEDLAVVAEGGEIDEAAVEVLELDVAVLYDPNDSFF
jgi:hypothetical protein